MPLSDSDLGHLVRLLADLQLDLPEGGLAADAARETAETPVERPLPKAKAKAKAKTTYVPLAPVRVTEDRRVYCVWSLPAPDAEAGIGLYEGPHPQVWEAIVVQCGGSYAGSGASLRRYSTLAEAGNHWLSDAPKRLRASLAQHPPLHQY